MLVTVGTYRVKSVSFRSASTVCKNLMVRMIGLRCRCFSLASAQMAGPCRSPLPSPTPPPRLTSSGPQQNRQLQGGTPANFG